MSSQNVFFHLPINKLHFVDTQKKIITQKKGQSKTLSLLKHGEIVKTSSSADISEFKVVLESASAKSDENITIEIYGEKLANKDLLGKSDPYFEIWR